MIFKKLWKLLKKNKTIDMICKRSPTGRPFLHWGKVIADPNEAAKVASAVNTSYGVSE